MVGWLAGWMDGQTDGWMDGKMNKQDFRAWCQMLSDYSHGLKMAPLNLKAPWCPKSSLPHTHRKPISKDKSQIVLSLTCSF